MNQAMVLRPGELGFVEQPDPEISPSDVKIRIHLSGLSSRSEIERYARNPSGKPERIGYNVVGVVEDDLSRQARVTAAEEGRVGSLAE